MLFIRFILSLILLNISALLGEIIQINKIGELEHLWDELKEDVLVVFDIDDVIFSTEDQFAHPYGYLKFVEFTNEALIQVKSQEEKDEIMRKVSLSQLLGKRRLVEETMPQFIKDLQKSGIKLVALTNFPRGQYGAISRTETWRIESLKALGIDFSHSFPEEESHEFDHIKSLDLAPPLFEEGILFANGHPKGEVLKSFFSKSKFYPSKVIFIDDLLHNHTSVNRALDELKIPFMGIHYTGASEHFGAFDEELLKLQFDHLLSTSTWLSDQETKEKFRGTDTLKRN